MTFLNNWRWLCIFTSTSINSVWHQWQFTSTSAIEQHLQTHLESFTVSNEIIREQPGQIYLNVKMCFMSSIIFMVNIFFSGALVSKSWTLCNCEVGEWWNCWFSVFFLHETVAYIQKNWSYISGECFSCGYFLFLRES